MYQQAGSVGVIGRVPSTGPRTSAEVDWIPVGDAPQWGGDDGKVSRKFDYCSSLRLQHSATIAATVHTVVFSCRMSPEPCDHRMTPWSAVVRRAGPAIDADVEGGGACAPGGGGSTAGSLPLNEAGFEGRGPQSERSRGRRGAARMDERGNVASRRMLVFNAKVDTWLLVPIAGSTVVCLSGAWLALSEGGQGRWATALILLVSAAIPVWIVLSTSYRLGRTQLRVRCGPFRWTIPLAEIRDVRPTRNPLSSPAPSLDRLRIDYGDRRSVMISPRDKEGFLRELEARTANARRRPP